MYEQCTVPHNDDGFPPVTVAMAVLSFTSIGIVIMMVTERIANFTILNSQPRKVSCCMRNCSQGVP